MSAETERISLNITKKELAQILVDLDIADGLTSPEEANLQTERYLEEAGSYIEMARDEWPEYMLKAVSEFLSRK